jgi:YD repeat-containing protein
MSIGERLILFSRIVAHIQFNVPAGQQRPTSQNQTAVHLQPAEEGPQFDVWWKYNSIGNYDYFEIKGTGENVFVTTAAETYPATNQPKVPYVKDGLVYRIGKISDQVGSFITLDYEDKLKTIEISDGNGGSNPVSYYLRNLKTIKDSTGVALLTLNTNSVGSFVNITDRFNRSVYYSVQTLPNQNMVADWPDEVFALTSTSQIVATGTSSPPARYVYGYTPEANQHPGNELIPTLSAISVPSPTGTGMSTATISYDSNGLIDGLTDANGNVKEFISSSSTNLTEVRIKNSSGTLVEKYFVEYDSKMNTTKFKNANGVTTSTKIFAGTNPYKPTSVSDAYGRTWNYTWDAYGNNLTSTTPRLVTTTNTYDYSVSPLGRVTSTQEGSKTSTTYQYYANGLTWKINAPIPGETGTGNRQTTILTYTAMGSPLTIVTPGNNAEASHTTTLGYTVDGTHVQAEMRNRPITITNSNNEVTHARYDSRGNKTSSWNPLGHTTTSLFNIADQVTDTYYPPTGNTGGGSSRSQSVFHYPGGRVSQSNSYNESGILARQVNTTYGAEGEALSTTGSAEDVYRTYTSAYRLKTLRDGAGVSHTTTYNYNTLGQLTEVLMPGYVSGDTDRVQFQSHDDNGRLLTRRDGRGVVTTYNYAQPDGALNSINYSPGGSVTPTYDTYGRQTSLADLSGTSSSVYDDLGSVTSSTRTYTGVPAETFSYAYYPDGSRQAMTNSAGTWSYLYDKVGRYTSMTSPLGTTTSVWDAASRQTKRTLPNSAWTDYTYNDLGMPTSLINKKSGGTIISQWGTFIYDDAFNLQSNTLTNSAAGVGVQNFVHDTKDRLTQESSPNKFGGYTENSAFDGAGNPTTFRNASGKTYNVDNQQAATNLAYDGNGNTTNYFGISAAYDAENRLTSFASTYSVTAGYRADGLRAWKQFSYVQGPEKRYFYYDNGNVVLEKTAAGVLKATNTYAPDGLVGRAWSGQNRYFLFDWQGNVANIMSSVSTLKSSWGFNAWGFANAISPYSLDVTWDDCFGYNARWGYLKEFGFNTSLGARVVYLCQNRYYMAMRVDGLLGIRSRTEVDLTCTDIVQVAQLELRTRLA